MLLVCGGGYRNGKIVVVFRIPVFIYAVATLAAAVCPTPRCIAFAFTAAHNSGLAPDRGSSTGVPSHRHGTTRAWINNTDRYHHLRANRMMDIPGTFHRNDSDDDSHEPTTTTATTTTSSSPQWGGDFSEDVAFAARLVLDAAELCRGYRKRQLLRRTAAASAASSALDKTDGTPVTALDFAIQGFIVSSLRRYEALRSGGGKSGHHHRDHNNTVSFWAEEDASDLRENPDLSRSALGLARSLDPSITREDFLDALDSGDRSNNNNGIGNKQKDDRSGAPNNIRSNNNDDGDRLPEHQPPHHRCWILDPIDGTRGLLAGKSYAIGLALCVGGEVVVGIVGNPSVEDPSLRVMASVRGHGLRYHRRRCRRGNNNDDRNNNNNNNSDIIDDTHRGDGGGGCDDGRDNDDEDESLFWDPPRNIPDGWHTRDYDPDGISSSSSSQTAGVDYPPYYVSRGPKPTTTMTTTSKSGVTVTGDLPPAPLPFGPSCPPTVLCCGSLVKYYAIASGRAAGFLQLPSGSSALVKSWDHAAGLLCVEESGGSVVVVEDGGDDDDDTTATTAPSRLPRFDRPEFPIHRGIVCVSRETDGATKRRLVDSVRRLAIR